MLFFGEKKKFGLVLSIKQRKSKKQSSQKTQRTVRPLGGATGRAARSQKLSDCGGNVVSSTETFTKKDDREICLSMMSANSSNFAVSVTPSK